MAQKVKIILIDDIDGVGYEIDLSEAHASELPSALADHVGAARRSKESKPRSNASGAFASSRNQEAAQIREWARENGYNVSSQH